MAQALTCYFTALMRYSERQDSTLDRFPSQRFWVDYDTEADVLYVSLERPQKGTNSVLTDSGVLLRYRGDQLVGVTILEASARGEMWGSCDLVSTTGEEWSWL